MGDQVHQSSDTVSEGRRKFLKNTGRFAAATPPAVALLLSTTLEANAIAKSCDPRGHLKLRRKMKKKMAKKKMKKVRQHTLL